ncbi:hypothetical protein Y032_0002g915 [Ancylostoma ceylanicum]|uniref:Uncharacterized protein n=1 Tax=Ancylostoma ceylanicum TaxID=53326 RepID=A0A016W2Z8_9BILA|nr:hypothetical protein Y032_0002g915 [Ancylostoma ceylanicum]
MYFVLNLFQDSLMAYTLYDVQLPSMTAQVYKVAVDGGDPSAVSKKPRHDRLARAGILPGRIANHGVFLVQWSTFILFAWITAGCNRSNRTVTRVPTVPPKPEVKRTVAGRPVPIASKSDETSVDRTSVQSKTPTRTKIEGLSPFLREEAKTQDDSASVEVKQPGLGSTNAKQSETSPDVRPEKWLPYPEVKETTKSAKKRRALQLEQEKRAKIATGFYQPRSDVDDTLDQVQSLEMERSEKQKSKFKWLNSFQSSIAKKVK